MCKLSPEEVVGLHTWILGIEVWSSAEQYVLLTTDSSLCPLHPLKSFR